MEKERVSQKETGSVNKKVNLEYMRDKDREKVKGIFRFHEVPGGRLQFSYKAYKGDQVEKYDLVDGMIYNLPLGVAKHLNKNLWYPIHAYHMNEQGMPSMFVNKKVRRCSFQSLEFVDIEDLSPDGAPAIEIVSAVV